MFYNTYNNKQSPNFIFYTVTKMLTLLAILCLKFLKIVMKIFFVTIKRVNYNFLNVYTEYTRIVESVNRNNFNLK